MEYWLDGLISSQGALHAWRLDMDEDLLHLKNIGKTMVLWLNRAGIHSTTQLKRLGAAKAYQAVIQRRESRISRSFLFALEGALTDQAWTDLSLERKQELIQLVRGDPTGDWRSVSHPPG